MSLQYFLNVRFSSLIPIRRFRCRCDSVVFFGTSLDSAYFRASVRWPGWAPQYDTSRASRVVSPIKCPATFKFARCHPLK